MGTLRVLLPWLALFLLQAASASSEAKLGCLGTCGDIEVPYPFGLRSNCSLRKDFLLTCNEFVVPHKLMWGNLQVFNLNVEQGEMTISLPISYGCYKGGQQMTNQSANYHANLIENSPFTFSNKNRFTTVGCDTLGLFSGSWGKSFVGGCATYCNNLSSLDANSSSCDGVGCCQTAIPKGVRRANINVSSFDYYKLSQSVNDLNCGYAFLVGEDNFTFQPDIDLKADQLLQSRPSMPVLIDWAIGGQGDTCKTSTGEKGPGGSGCLAKHSECISSAAGYGYRCNCSKGYFGNPYLENDGCQDINECESPDLHNCASIDTCVNMDGGYRCECPHGQKGNGTKGEEECKRDTPVAYGAVATCVSIMFLLLGVGRLVVRYKHVPKWPIKKDSNQKKPDLSSSTGEDVRRNAKKKKRYPAVKDEYLQAGKIYKKKLRTLIADNRCAPIMLCLAWLDVNAKTGKPFGTITHPFSKAEIHEAINLLAKLQEKHPFNQLSNPDICQLAGVMAVEVAGGPDVAFHPGRTEDIGTEDSIDKYLSKVIDSSLSSSVGGHLPLVESPLGLSLIESSLSLCVHDIVAISPWLRCNKDCSGLQFTWPPTFDNSYFKQLISVIGDKESLHYHDQDIKKDEFIVFVRKYAEDEASFFAAYAKSHMKLSELGFADTD